MQRCEFLATLNVPEDWNLASRNGQFAHTTRSINGDIIPGVGLYFCDPKDHSQVIHVQLSDSQFRSLLQPGEVIRMFPDCVEILD